MNDFVFIHYLISWMLVLLLGTGLWATLAGIPRTRLDVIASAGYGLLLGMFAASFIVGLVPKADPRHLQEALWLAFVLPGAITWIWVWRSSLSRISATPRIRPFVLTSNARWIWWMLLILLMARAGFLLDEILLRPLFPWDAWSAWAVKPKAWYLGGARDQFVDTVTWLAQSGHGVRTALGWPYPELIGRIELWFASGAGAWNEPLINLPWFMLWLSLLMTNYWSWRQLNVHPLFAMVGIYALGSLPLLNINVALAGYADLWLATVLGLTVLAWLRWQQTKDRRHLLLALIFATCLPAIKLEGMAWLLMFLAVLSLSALPERLRIRGAVIGSLSGLLLVYGAWQAAPNLSIHFLDTARQMIANTGNPPLTKQLSQVITTMLNGMFVQSNWHLLWYVFVGVLLVRWRVLMASPQLRFLGLFLLLAGGFFVLLFFFSSSADFALRYTASNRLLMQVVPVVVTFIVLLVRDIKTTARPGTTPALVPPNNPA